MLSEVFWTFLISSSVALIAKIATLCFKSKCKEVNLCCLKVIRDTEVEEKETEFMTLQQQQKQQQQASPNCSSDDETSNKFS
jgi:hypothetical protein